MENVMIVIFGYGDRQDVSSGDHKADLLFRILQVTFPGFIDHPPEPFGPGFLLCSHPADVSSVDLECNLCGDLSGGLGLNSEAFGHPQAAGLEFAPGESKSVGEHILHQSDLLACGVIIDSSVFHVVLRGDRPGGNCQAELDVSFDLSRMHGPVEETELKTLPGKQGVKVETMVSG